MEESNQINGCKLLSLSGFSLVLSLVCLPIGAASAENLPSQPMAYMNLAVNEFVYNPRSLEWKAINHKGKVVKTGRGSGGQSYCSDIKRSCRTPAGTYNVIGKGGPGCKSSRYPVGKGGAPMPYCMYFSKNYAIHGSYDLPKRNASHGCVRVRPSDAKWLNQNFVGVGTRVVIKPY